MRDTIVVSASSSITTASVNIQAMSFTPKKTTIAPGGKVTWTNLDALNHTVTSD